MPRKQSFSDLIRSTSIDRGLSVAEVAERVGVIQASVYFWEGDHTRPRDENLTALCKVLKLPVKTTRELSAA
jgi:transcriptional regulator with XRE-family HTH domain